MVAMQEGSSGFRLSDLWIPFLGAFLLLQTLYHAPAVTQHASYCRGTAVINGAFKELSLDDFKFF